METIVEKSLCHSHYIIMALQNITIFAGVKEKTRLALRSEVLYNIHLFLRRVFARNFVHVLSVFIFSFLS
jgi:hypothetical protein